jgi:TonB family protein
VPQEGFRTQVLLLHSEQSTLDHLSAGFDDSFTVHCATSGSEALNTLVDTPINVIVTAQDLPGMSGLEALREARKRSPETIGILLAGDADEGLEALVGDKEVFQVVRGDVSGDSISRLVENATQQMRLMALASSANDAAADVDEPSAEHIVMETSENGSTIISDGTGRLRALDAANSSASSAAGTHSVELLVLTKDSEFLASIKESSRGTHGVHYASTLAQADALIREHKIGVAVVDAAMVGEKIEQLTAHLRKGSPRIVTIVAGRRDDGEMMMDLINRSKVYRFLLKPVSPGRARLAIEASARHHLEAPDAAFNAQGAAAPTIAAPAARKATAVRADVKPGQELESASARKSSPADKSDESLKTGTHRAPHQPPSPGNEPTPASLKDAAPPDTRGKPEANFTETVTGLFGKPVEKPGAKKARSPKPDAASRRQDSTPVSASSGGSLFKNPKMLGMGAVTLIALAAIALWFSGGSDETANMARPGATAPVAIDADAAADGGANIVYGESSASGASSGIEPGTDVAALVDQALAETETALLESRIEDASNALEVVAKADPENLRLPFLRAQLSQLQLREFMDDARAAIRESRFEDAGLALEDARLLGVADIAELDAIENELSEARSAQRAENVLEMANARLEDGDLLSPANDNARHYFELALQNDPDNVAAQQGLSVIASKLALQARSETDNGNLDAAEALLVDATALDAGNSELAAAVAALADKRDAIAKQRRQAEARRRAEAERAAAKAREAEQRRTAAAAAQPVKETAKLDAAGTADAKTREAGETAAPAADRRSSEESQRADAAASAEASQAEEPEQADTRNAASQPSPTAVSALNRIKYVAPKYPRAAERRNLSGWVDVVFTVDTDGLVKDVEVRGSEPGETFVAAAVRAVEKWEFEPVVEDGQAVEKRAGVRMMFALE